MKKVVIASVMILGLTAPLYACPTQSNYSNRESYQPLPPRPMPVRQPMVAPVGPGGPGPGIPAAYPYGPWGGPYLPCVPSSGCGYY